MSIKNLGAGSVATADVRSELTAAAALPTHPHFLIRASDAVPLVLATLALDFTLLIQQPVETDTGWIAVPIQHPLSVGQRLVWTMLTGAAVPRVAAFLVINQELKYLKHKDGLAAGAAWSPDPVVLRPSHLG
jgi:hypothetical protein